MKSIHCTINVKCTFLKITIDDGTFLYIFSLMSSFLSFFFNPEFWRQQVRYNMNRHDRVKAILLCLLLFLKLHANISKFYRFVGEG